VLSAGHRGVDVSGVVAVLRSRGRGLGSTAATNGANMALGLVTGVLTARLLEPHDRGILLAVLVWTATIGTFALGGLSDAVIYRANGSEARSWALGRALRPTMHRYSAWGILISATINIAATINCGTTVILAALACSFTVPLHVYGQMVLAPLRVSGRFRAWNGLRLVPASVYTVGCLGAAMLDWLTVASALACMSVASAMTAFLCSKVTVPAAASAVDAHAEVPTLRGYGLRLTLSNIPHLVSQRLDQLLLALLAEPSMLGKYAVAVSVASVLQVIGLTLEQVLFPRFAARPNRSRIALMPTLLAVCGTTALAGALLVACADSLINAVYGPSYAAAEAPLKVLMIGVVALAASVVLGAEAKAQGRLTHLVRAEVAGAIVTLVSLPIMLPTLGIVGAAIASTSSYAITTFLLLIYRKWPLKPDTSVGLT
jgi:O-antigen/teichoic acid export membrane protein